MCCLDADYDYYVKLLRLFYLTDDLIPDSLESVRTALGVLQAATALCSNSISQICIEYLEAVPREDKEEEAILKLKTSAQEQVEYMLMEDEDLPLITTDDDVKAVVEIGLAKLVSRTVGKLEKCSYRCLFLTHGFWDLAVHLVFIFISSWANVSVNVLSVVQDKKLSSGIWAVKVRLIEVTAKVLEAVGYGNVILPAPSRVQLLKLWLPYISHFTGACIAIQAEILTDWMEVEQVRYPDLSEAFEVWCYRTKAAKQRLQVGFNEVGNTTVSL
ncbi:hypothetical protein ACLOJK_029944 [Asimina triloba]